MKVSMVGTSLEGAITGGHDPQRGRTPHETHVSGLSNGMNETKSIIGLIRNKWPHRELTIPESDLAMPHEISRVYLPRPSRLVPACLSPSPVLGHHLSLLMVLGRLKRTITADHSLSQSACSAWRCAETFVWMTPVGQGCKYCLHV